MTSEKRWRFNTFTPYRGLPGLMPAIAIRCRPSRGRTDVAHAGTACDRLCLPVTGDGLLQRSPADATIGLSPKRRSQPCRNRSSDKVVPVRRLLGYRGDRVRPARTAYRVDRDLRVGGR